VAAYEAGSKEGEMDEQEAKKEIAQAKEELLEAKAKLKELNAKLMELSEVMEKIEAAQGRLQKVEDKLLREEFTKQSFFDRTWFNTTPADPPLYPFPLTPTAPSRTTCNEPIWGWRFLCKLTNYWLWLYLNLDLIRNFKIIFGMEAKKQPFNLIYVLTNWEVYIEYREFNWKGGNKIMKRYFFLVVLVLLAYVGTTAVTQAAGPAPVDQAKLQQIKIGVTTESEVRSLLGEPTSAKDEIVPIHGGHELVPIKILVYRPVGSEVSIYIYKTGKVYKILK
jgi:hypothetical protein